MFFNIDIVTFVFNFKNKANPSEIRDYSDHTQFFFDKIQYFI